MPTWQTRRGYCLSLAPGGAASSRRLCLLLSCANGGRCIDSYLYIISIEHVPRKIKHEKIGDEEWEEDNDNKDDESEAEEGDGEEEGTIIQLLLIYSVCKRYANMFTEEVEVKLEEAPQMVTRSASKVCCLCCCFDFNWWLIALFRG